MQYFLIQSQDPFEHASVAHDCELAQDLANSGASVTVFLIQNGVLACREAASGEVLQQLTNAGVTILADEFGLRERAIDREQLRPGVTVAGMDAVLDALLGGHKVLWL
jgi:predicted peroxiredoxin